ncbi:MAG: hypothetical protein JNL48_02465 [Acidobacteria bacterium]|nr:hypothetical protein [Acidobacteriota bacterium]
MDEQQVRLLVRQAIARHMGAPPASDAATGAAAAGPVVPPPARPATAASPTHASFARFHLVRPAGETECLIEPTVTCNHCGHCQCYGH